MSRQCAGASGLEADLLPVAKPGRRGESGSKSWRSQNGTLKRLLAEAELEKAALKDWLSEASRDRADRRTAVAHRSGR